MNQQFATQFLLEDYDEKFESVKSTLIQAGASEDAAIMLATAVKNGHLEPSAAIQIVKNTTGLSEDGGAPAAAGGGSTTGGGVTNGASFTVGTGEQYASTKAFKKRVHEGDSKPMFKVGDKVKYLGHPAVITKVEKDVMDRWQYNVSYNKGTGLTKATNILNKGGEIKPISEDAPMYAAGKADISTYTQDGFKKVEGHPKLKSIEPKDLWGTSPTAMSEDVDEVWDRADFPKITKLLDKIKQQNADLYDKIKWALEMDLAPHTYDDVEAMATKAGLQLNLQENYNRFKKETKIRPKQDQYHEAIKVVNKKLDEVNRLLEFTSRMREELSEGEETLEVKARTAKTMDKLKTKIAEAYKKLKHLN